MSQKFCSRCGAPNSENAMFCANCGNQLYVVPAQSYTQTKRPGRGLGITSMVLGIYGLFCAFGSLGVIADELYFSVFILPLYFIYLISPTLATIFSIFSRKKGYICGISSSGLVMGIIGLSIICLSIFISVISYAMY